MRIRMNRPTAATGAGALLVLGLFFAACAAQDEFDAVLAVPEFLSDTIGVHATADWEVDEVDELDQVGFAPMNSTAAPRPELAVRRPVPVQGDTTRPPLRFVSLIQGRVAFLVDEKQELPAEFIRVVLQGRGGTYVVSTSRGGEFFFENIPPGDYRFEITTWDKEARVLHEGKVVVDPVRKMQLEDIRLSPRADR